MGMTLITPPVTEPVLLADVKRQCRVHSSDTTYDAELQGYLTAAIAYLDGPNGILQIALEPQTWRYTLDGFDGNITLPTGPVVEIDSIKYYIDDELETIDAADYVLRQIADYRSEVVPVVAWPATDTGTDRVQIDFTVGFVGDLDSESHVPEVPHAIRQAILLLVNHWFTHRSAIHVGSTVTEVPLAFDALLKPFKRIVLA
jgi:uncharacterized phiE125 gp8 family phage protein